MLNLILEKKAAKLLTSLQSKDLSLAKRLIIKIKELQANPLDPDSKSLKGSKLYRRSRVGKYRIIYKYSDSDLYIILIAKRDEVYKYFMRSL
ncbi:MAG: type II toxin-antitoxin system RelE/ParE family toxin [Rickettsiales bacterium]